MRSRIIALRIASRFLASEGNEGEFGGFAGLSQPFVEDFEGAGAANSIEGGHVEGQGYMDAMANQAPRLARQIVAPSGKVLDAIPERTEVSIGQFAGWPTAAQYEAAAKRALEKAAAIRERQQNAA